MNRHPLLSTAALLLLVGTSGGFAMGTDLADSAGSAAVAGDIVIDCANSPSREVILAGGAKAHFSCESHAANGRSYHGLCAGMHEFFDSWAFTAGRRAYLPTDASRVRVGPSIIVREYEDGGSETVFLPRGLAGMLIELRPGLDGPGVFTPWLEIRQIWEVPKPEYRAEWNERLGALFVEREGFAPPDGVPSILCLFPGPQSTWTSNERRETRSYPRDEARRAMGETHPWSPGAFRFAASAGQPFQAAVGLGIDRREAFAVAREILDDQEHLRAEANAHRQALADGVPISGDARYDRALLWSRWSLDNLTMNARGPGIYAGYHWFTNYWGRDSFISLPGACLVNGDYDRARAILLSFAEHQLQDPTSQRLGRLPNIVNPGNLQYAGVDGTWWWVRAVRLYLEATGDREFLELAWPVVDRAVRGALAKAVDERGLLKHGDGETWMDAGGEHNPFSPRGDRAVEVQVLWLDGLNTAMTLAAAVGDTASVRRLVYAAGPLKQNLALDFTRGDGLGLADHLDIDGGRDLQIRPNQIFALTLPGWNGPAEGPDNFWGAPLVTEILQTTIKHCVLPHGVTSLDPADPAWLARHLDLEHHYYDAAYHNGDVWLWLSGPVIQALCDAGRADDAWEMMQPLIDDLLDHGAVGSTREIRDGEARSLEDFGGATSQAWSLAEFLRVTVEGFLGFRPNAFDREVLLRPMLPAALPVLTSRVHWGGRQWNYHVERSGATMTPLPITEKSRATNGQMGSPWIVHLRTPAGELQMHSTVPADGDTLRWSW